MRTVSALAALTALFSGCYLSHDRPARDGGLDAPTSDAPIDAPPRIDAPPTCRASCEPAVSLIRFDGEPTVLGNPQLIVREGTALVLFTFGGDLRRYVLFRVDAEDGRLRGRSEIPIFPPPESTVLMGAHLSGPLEALTLTWAESPARWVLDWHAVVREQALDRSGRPASAVRDLGMLRRRRGDDGRRVSVLGRDRVESVVFYEGETVALTPIDEDGVGEEREIAHVAGAPRGFGAVDGVALAGGGWAVAFGGSQPRLEPREAFIVFQQLDGSVVTEPLPGELDDPPADLVASGDGFGLARLISDSRVLDPRVLVQARDADGRVLDAIEVRPAGRFAPVALAAFDVDGAPGAAWIERDRTLRILPPPNTGDVGAWSECDGIATSSVLPSEVSLPGTSGSELALAAIGDGSGDLLVLVESGGRYELFRVPGCRLDRAR